MPTSNWSPIASENKIITDSEGLSTNILELNPRPYSTKQAIQALMASIASFNLDDTYTNNIMNWMGEWVSQPYRKNDVVEDDGWLMIANKDTEERAGIFPSGSPFYVYEGTIGTTGPVAKQIIFGNRYTMQAEEAGYLTGYRVYTITGNNYTIYSIQDPLGEQVVNQVQTITAQSTGWTTYSINNTILFPGDVFDIVVVASEPAGTPVTWASDWNYVKPQNDTIPVAGQITQSGKSPSLLWVHKTDGNLVDQSAQLAGIATGDIIEMNLTRWAVQAVGDLGDYIEFVVAPAQRDPALGLQTFTFETISPTPITYALDTDYWLTSQYTVSGLLGVDVPYDSIVPDNTAYGVDISVQRAQIPTDWDFMASSGSTSGQSQPVDINTSGYQPFYAIQQFSNNDLPAPVVGGLISIPDYPAGPIIAVGDGDNWYEVRTRIQPI